MAGTGDPSVDLPWRVRLRKCPQRAGGTSVISQAKVTTPVSFVGIRNHFHVGKPATHPVKKAREQVDIVNELTSSANQQLLRRQRKGHRILQLSLVSRSLSPIPQETYSSAKIYHDVLLAEVG